MGLERGDVLGGVVHADETLQFLAEVLRGLGHVEPAIGVEHDGGAVEGAGDEGGGQ